jgi:hypothetical protein
MGSDPQEMLAVAHRDHEAAKANESFEKTWQSLLKIAPNSFTAEDRKLAKLFYDIGTAAVIDRIKDSIQPFVDFAKLT